jgi:hypothetical protein
MIGPAEALKSARLGISLPIVTAVPLAPLSVSRPLRISAIPKMPTAMATTLTPSNNARNPSVNR